MAKSTREKIKLVSSAGTGHYYTTAKNKRLHPDKMETKKYDPVVRKARDVQGSKDQIRMESKARESGLF